MIFFRPKQNDRPMPSVRWYLQFLFYLLSGISVLTVVACIGPWQERPERIAPKPSDRIMNLYRQALVAYQDGAYEKAARMFADTRQQTDDGQLARMALYGQACAGLMAAETPETYYQALKLWQDWVQNAPFQLEHEDPVLFNPLIERKMLFSRIPLGGNASEKLGEETVPKWVHIRLKQELDALEKKLNQTQQTLKQQNKLVESQKNEITKLNEQLKALETIDQKIQKKKDAIPTTD
jgi:TolA-binding protein